MLDQFFALGISIALTLKLWCRIPVLFETTIKGQLDLFAIAALKKELHLKNKMSEELEGVFKEIIK